MGDQRLLSQMKHTFASDNYSGVHPDIMDALRNANHGHAGSYGSDEYTAKAVEKFKEYFGEDVEVFFAYNGTGANVLGLSSLMKSFHAVVCSELAHIHVDESTAPERFIGCRQITLPTRDGKIYPADIEKSIQRINDPHHPQAKVISISQPTEYGTVYTVDEIVAIASTAKRFGLYFHMDGSRICNAAVSLKCDFRVFTRDAGVDVLSFGGTKNGMMFGEAIVFFQPALARDFKFLRKQGMQLHSKMRFISAQFAALLSNDCWRRNAVHANAMATKLANELGKIPQIKITQSVDANGVFAIFPQEIVPTMQEEQFFYVWTERVSEVRLMCSFDTKEEDISNFISKLQELVKGL
jgi:threonine aldolase